jgi:hypothetical protein
MLRTSDRRVIRKTTESAPAVCARRFDAVRQGRKGVASLQGCNHEPRHWRRCPLRRWAPALQLGATKRCRAEEMRSFAHAGHQFRTYSGGAVWGTTRTTKGPRRWTIPDSTGSHARSPPPPRAAACWPGSRPSAGLALRHYRSAPTPGSAKRGASRVRSAGRVTRRRASASPNGTAPPAGRAPPSVRVGCAPARRGRNPAVARACPHVPPAPRAGSSPGTPPPAPAACGRGATPARITSFNVVLGQMTSPAARIPASRLRRIPPAVHSTPATTTSSATRDIVAPTAPIRAAAIRSRDSRWDQRHWRLRH